MTPSLMNIAAALTTVPPVKTADTDYDVADRLVDVARDKGVAPIQLALAWVLREPAMAAPIVSVTRLEQLEQLVAGLDITMTDEDAARIEEPYKPHPVLGHF